MGGRHRVSDEASKGHTAVPGALPQLDAREGLSKAATVSSYRKNARHSRQPEQQAQGPGVGTGLARQMERPVGLDLVGRRGAWGEGPWRDAVAAWGWGVAASRRLVEAPSGEQPDSICFEIIMEHGGLGSHREAAGGKWDRGE